MLSHHFILCHPLLLLPLLFPSIKVFSNSGLISFRIHWFDLLAVQETLKSLLQHNLKASIIWCAASFMVQLSHPNVTTGKATALTIQTIVSKEMSLLFNMLSRFVIAFLPRRKHLLISWLQSPSIVGIEIGKISPLVPLIIPIKGEFLGDHVFDTLEHFCQTKE